MEISDILFKRIEVRGNQKLFLRIYVVDIRLIVLQKFSQKYQGCLHKYQKFRCRNAKQDPLAEPKQNPLAEPKQNSIAERPCAMP